MRTLSIFILITAIMAFSTDAFTQSPPHLQLTAHESDLVNTSLIYSMSTSQLSQWCGIVAENENKVLEYNSRINDRINDNSRLIREQENRLTTALGLEPQSELSIRDRILKNENSLSRGVDFPEPSSDVIKAISSASKSTNLTTLRFRIELAYKEFQNTSNENKRLNQGNLLNSFEKNYFDKVLIEHCSLLDGLQERKASFLSRSGRNGVPFTFCKYTGHGERAENLKDLTLGDAQLKILLALKPLADLRFEKILLRNSQYEGQTLLQLIQINLDKIHKNTNSCTTKPQVKIAVAHKPRPKPKVVDPDAQSTMPSEVPKFDQPSTPLIQQPVQPQAPPQPVQPEPSSPQANPTAIR